MGEVNRSAVQDRNYKREAWLNSNDDIIDALMESKELLKKTRELIYQEGRAGELKCGKS